MYKDLSNFSIFRTIKDLLDERELKGLQTDFHKVDSHLVDTPEAWERATLPQKLNATADKQADSGLEREISIDEPIHNLAPAVLDAASERFESRAYHHACRLLDAVVFEWERDDYEKRLESKRRRGEPVTNVSRYSVLDTDSRWWMEASLSRRVTRHSGLDFFAYKLLFRCLHSETIV